MRNSIGISGAVQTDVLRQILVDANYLRKIGAWPEVVDMVRAVAQEHQRQERNCGIGSVLDLDWLASDVAQVVGVHRDVVRREAQRALFPSRLEAIAAELKRCRAEYGQRRQATSKSGGGK